MGGVMDAEVVLAEAVIRLAIRDVRRGTPEERARALRDITDGGLDYWAEVVCCEGCRPDALLDALHTALPVLQRTAAPR